MVMYQNRQVMVTSFTCCWFSGSASQSPNCWGGGGGWGMAGDSYIVIKDVCEDGMRNLGGKLMLMFTRAGILVGDLVMMAVGVISISQRRCMSVTE